MPAPAAAWHGPGLSEPVAVSRSPGPRRRWRPSAGQRHSKGEPSPPGPPRRPAVRAGGRPVQTRHGKSPVLFADHQPQEPHRPGPEAVSSCPTPCSLRAHDPGAPPPTRWRMEPVPVAEQGQDSLAAQANVRGRALDPSLLSTRPSPGGWRGGARGGSSGPGEAARVRGQPGCPFPAAWALSPGPRRPWLLGTVSLCLHDWPSRSLGPREPGPRGPGGRCSGPWTPSRHSPGVRAACRRRV